MVPTFYHSGGDVFAAGQPFDDDDIEHFYELYVAEQTAAFRAADFAGLRRFNGLLASLTKAIADRSDWRNCMDPMLGSMAEDIAQHIARKANRKGA